MLAVISPDFLLPDGGLKFAVVAVASPSGGVTVGSTLFDNAASSEVCFDADAGRFSFEAVVTNCLLADGGRSDVVNVEETTSPFPAAEAPGDTPAAAVSITGVV